MGFVLGLSGASQSGKDTVADYLISKHGWSGKLSFARNLKDMCKAVFGLSEEDVETQEGKKRIFLSPKKFNNSHLGSITYWMYLTHPDALISDKSYAQVKSLQGRVLKTPREVLQFVGTDVCRTLIPTYHVDIVLRDAQIEGNWVITDVRFPNEAELVAGDLKGAVVRIDRELSDDGSVNRAHDSETAMSSWKGYLDCLDNTEEGLDFLFTEVDKFLERNNYKCLTE